MTIATAFQSNTRQDKLSSSSKAQPRVGGGRPTHEAMVREQVWISNFTSLDSCKMVKNTFTLVDVTSVFIQVTAASAQIRAPACHHSSYMVATWRARYDSWWWRNTLDAESRIGAIKFTTLSWSACHADFVVVLWQSNQLMALLGTGVVAAALTLKLQLRGSWNCEAPAHEFLLNKIFNAKRLYWIFRRVLEINCQFWRLCCQNEAWHIKSLFNTDRMRPAWASKNISLLINALSSFLN